MIFPRNNKDTRMYLPKLFSSFFSSSLSLPFSHNNNMQMGKMPFRIMRIVVFKLNPQSTSIFFKQISYWTRLRHRTRTRYSYSHKMEMTNGMENPLRDTIRWRIGMAQKNASQSIDYKIYYNNIVGLSPFAECQPFRNGVCVPRTHSPLFITNKPRHSNRCWHKIEENAFYIPRAVADNWIQYAYMQKNRGKYFLQHVFTPDRSDGKWQNSGERFHVHVHRRDETRAHAKWQKLIENLI